MGLNTQVQNNESKSERTVYAQWNEEKPSDGDGEKGTRSESMSIFIWFYWQYIWRQSVIGDELYGWFIYMLHVSVCLFVNFLPFLCASNDMNNESTNWQKESHLYRCVSVVANCLFFWASCTWANLPIFKHLTFTCKATRLFKWLSMRMRSACIQYCTIIAYIKRSKLTNDAMHTLIIRVYPFYVQYWYRFNINIRERERLRAKNYKQIQTKKYQSYRVRGRCVSRALLQSFLLANRWNVVTSIRAGGLVNFGRARQCYNFFHHSTVCRC